MTHDLPPLPEILGDGFTRKWIEDRMQAYALAAIAPYKAEIERLKLECANTELDSGEYKLRAEKAEAEVARLKAGGCARDQRLTQYCAEAARLAEENAKLRTTLEIVLHRWPMPWASTSRRFQNDLPPEQRQRSVTSVNLVVVEDACCYKVSQCQRIQRYL
jgi:chromosome segregation ATPase